MIRHFYISDDINELKQVEQELESNGFTEPQIHVLSEHDAEVENHQLHEVQSVLKQDIVHSTEIGSVIGISLAIITLLIAYAMGWTETAAGWMPFIFLSIVIVGFCTWEGGFIGIQQPNVNFKRFQEILRNGKHVFFVDVTPEQERTINNIMKKHPLLQNAGVGEATPHWVVDGQDKFNRFMKFMP
ncbi:hypothetical protein tinsulaeT_04520 [Thalassotalea insulae]|uniref:NAD/FAD-utilizing enzyme n=1 Tax=Thalassotalea insulae TaxID=2056778 RepID=A0ABQ6GMG4_9GAMM|nr:NAD/FAD-utilizing enzyme [Thalassotalea insulae]GLX77112.1 hypothetical protein tinsulaeT_04520 [Thalassotalea insulae]